MKDILMLDTVTIIKPIAKDRLTLKEEELLVLHYELELA